MTDGEPETVVWASLQKKRNRVRTKINIFYLIKSETSDSFVNHFDGYFAYLKTLDFSFKLESERTALFDTASALLSLLKLRSADTVFLLCPSQLMKHYLKWLSSLQESLRYIVSLFAYLVRFRSLTVPILRQLGVKQV